MELRATRTRVHDRFLIVDNQVYHLGASLKDLGRKLFAFSKMGLEKVVIMGQVNPYPRQTSTKQNNGQ